MHILSTRVYQKLYWLKRKGQLNAGKEKQNDDNLNDIFGRKVRVNDFLII